MFLFGMFYLFEGYDGSVFLVVVVIGVWILVEE